MVIFSGMGINGCYAVKCDDKFIRDFNAAIICITRQSEDYTYLDALIVIAFLEMPKL